MVIQSSQDQRDKERKKREKIEERAAKVGGVSGGTDPTIPFGRVQTATSEQREAKGKTFNVDGTQVRRSVFEAATGGGGDTSKFTPQELAIVQSQRSKRAGTDTGEQFREKVLSNQERLGLTPPIADSPRVEFETQGTEVTGDDRGILQKTLDFTNPFIDRETGRPIIDPNTGEPVEVQAGSIPFGPGGLMKFGGKIVEADRAVKLGTMAKISKTVKPVATAITGAGLFFLGLLGVTKFSDATVNRKVDETQQSLNTLGQITSTIAGISTSAAGDAQAGLVELAEIERSLLALEEGMTAGTISSATLKFDGKILDIEADVQDMLTEVIDARTQIQSFLLKGEFPRLSDQEIQNHLSLLRDEGLVKPVNLKSARRDVARNA